MLQICAHCSNKGASIGCRARHCSSCAHYSCAIYTGWKLDTDTFISTCSVHSVSSLFYTNSSFPPFSYYYFESDVSSEDNIPLILVRWKTRISVFYIIWFDLKSSIVSVACEISFHCWEIDSNNFFRLDGPKKIFRCSSSDNFTLMQKCWDWI